MDGVVLGLGASAWVGDAPLPRSRGCGASAAGLMLAMGAGGAIPSLQLSPYVRLQRF